MKRLITSLALSLLLPCALVAQTQKPIDKRYKDASLPIEQRLSILLDQMTLEEKVGQLNCLLGWEMYEKQGDNTVVASDQFKEIIDTQHIGMFWATLRADPWTKKTLLNGLNPELAAQATNELQRYMVENTRLGIPLFFAEECPHGHMAIGTTVFPTSIGQASTWNTPLIRQMATVIAEEARLQGGHIGYGPVIDLAREPRWSRVEESYGEDPEFSGEMGAAVVRGFQGEGIHTGRNVIATPKHFVAYGVPEGGHNGGSVSIGMRDLRQNYLYPFSKLVDAGVLSIMTAYNSIDGVPCSSNGYLLKDVLRGEWGFDGFVVSDLGSIDGLRGNHAVATSNQEAGVLALNAGLDVDLGGNAYKHLVDAYRDKEDISVIDEAVANVLKLKFEMGLFDNPYVDPAKAAQQVRNPQHIDLAAEVARQSIVLLKNDNALLPLKKEIKRIAVIGPNADNTYNQLGDYTAPQDPDQVITVLEGIQNKVGKSTQVSYVKGCAIRDTSDLSIREAVAAAREAEVAIVVLGGSSARDFRTEYLETGAATVSATSVSDMESGEGYDRSTLDLLGKQLELLREVVATGTPVVLVMIQGRPLLLNEPAELVPAILNAWYPGQQGGTAIADVLFGDYNPAGRLPISIPRSVGQLPVYYNYSRPNKHKYVESSPLPLYAFGHGLSYTSFTYEGLEITETTVDNQKQFDITFTLSNSGKRDGDEVVQLYLRDDVSSVVTPIMQLKQFRRVHLKANSQQQIHFTLTEKELQLVNAKMEWVAEPGTFTLMIGASSQDVRLQGKLEW